MSGGEPESDLIDPEDSGSDLSRSQPSPERVESLARDPSRSGVSPVSVSESLRHLQEPGIRGQAGMVLLYASVHGLEEQIRQLRDERDAVAQERDRLRDRLHECDTLNQVLRVQIRSGVQLSYFQNVSNTLGSLALGVTIPSLVERFSSGMMAVAMLGLGLCVMGWLPKNSGSREK